MSYKTNKTMERRGQGPARLRHSMGCAGIYGRTLTRCVSRRRRSLSSFLWLGVDMVLLFAVTAALSYLVLVRCMAPEWLVDLESAPKVVTREVRP